MKTKILLGALAVVIIAGGGYVYYSGMLGGRGAVISGDNTQPSGDFDQAADAFTASASEENAMIESDDNDYSSVEDQNKSVSSVTNVYANGDF